VLATVQRSNRRVTRTPAPAAAGQGFPARNAALGSAVHRAAGRPPGACRGAGGAVLEQLRGPVPDAPLPARRPPETAGVS